MPSNSELKAIMSRMQEQHVGAAQTIRSAIPDSAPRSVALDIAWQSFSLNVRMAPAEDGRLCGALFGRFPTVDDAL